MSEQRPRFRTIDIGAPRRAETQSVLGSAARRLRAILRAYRIRVARLLGPGQSRVRSSNES